AGRHTEAGAKSCRLLDFAFLVFAVLPALFDDRQRVARVHGGAFGGQYLLHFAALGRLHLVLHLHGFHDDDALPDRHFVLLADQDANDLARHGGLELLRANIAAADGAPGAQGARVLHIHGIACAADDHVQLTLERAFALDLVGLVSDQQRQHIARRQGDVHLDGLAVNLAEPEFVAAVQFHLMRLAVHYHVVGHDCVYRSLSASTRAAFRQFDAGAGAAALPLPGLAAIPGCALLGSVVAKIAAATAAITAYWPSGS